MERNTENSPRFLKPGEVSRILGLSPNTVRTAIRRGELPGIRVGGSYLVEREGLERLLAEAVPNGPNATV